MVWCLDMAKRLPNRCMSEIGPQNEQNQCQFKFHETLLCASPSLKHVIKPNVVQMRREAFEKICKEDLSTPMKRLSVVDEKTSCGRQVKSDSCVELFSNQKYATNGREKLRSSVNVDNLPSGTRPTTKPDVLFPKRSLATSCSVPPSDTNGGTQESTLPRRAKPQVQPKPSITPKTLPSPGFLKRADSPAESQRARQILLSADNCDVFLVNTDDVEKKSDSSEPNILKSERSQPQKTSLPYLPDITSPPIPPPKPPRSLSEMMDEGDSHEVAGYDRLTNTFSIVLPAVIPERQPVVEVVTPSAQSYPIINATSEYEELKDVVPAPTEVKKSEKGKKEGWGSKFLRFRSKKNSAHSKTTQVDNPNYGLLMDTDTDRPLVRYSSDNSLDRLKTKPVETKPVEELIYDVPYVVTGTVTTESRDSDALSDLVSFDEGGYAIPDVEGEATRRKSRVCLRVDAHLPDI